MFSQELVKDVCSKAAAVYEATCADEANIQKIMLSEDFIALSRRVRLEHPGMTDEEILAATLRGFSERLREA